MIPALIIGRKGSLGFPGKNTYEILGHPLCYYPMKAALDADDVGEIYLSTDDEKLKEIGHEMSINILDRPAELCGPEALGDDVFAHAFNEIKSANPNRDIEAVVLLFCNCPTLTSDAIQEGIKILREKPEVDSAVTVSRYNMWSPLRARKLDDGGLLKPFVPFETFGDPNNLNCDRDSQGDVFFADMGVSVVRPKCLEKLKEGLLPQKWMGQAIHPIYQEAGFDLDYDWQLPLAESWIKNNFLKQGDNQ